MSYSPGSTIEQPESDPAVHGRAQRGRYFVEALGRGLSVLDCFTEGPAQLTLTELSSRLGISKNTTFRLLRTLEEAGYVIQDQVTRHYHLSLKVLDLQAASLAALGYTQEAQPLLKELNAALGESVNLAVLEGTEIRYVARVAAKRIMSVDLRVGSRLPAHATSMGKVLLASLEEQKVRDLYATHPLTAYTPQTITSIDGLLEELALVRRQGFALADQELEVGLRSIAAPVRRGHGDIVAALNVSTATVRTSREQLLGDFLPQLLRTAEAISRRLGFRGPRTGDRP